MKIKAKKTNSASVSDIQSSYFVIQSRKLTHLSLVYEANDSLTWLYVPFYAFLCWTSRLKK